MFVVYTGFCVRIFYEKYGCLIDLFRNPILFPKRLASSHGAEKPPDISAPKRLTAQKTGKELAVDSNTLIFTLVVIFKTGRTLNPYTHENAPDVVAPACSHSSSKRGLRPYASRYLSADPSGQILRKFKVGRASFRVMDTASGRTQQYYQFSEGDKGWVEVTKLDRNSGQIRGRFDLTLSNSTSQTVHFKRGRFKSKLVQN